jgi:hypothetical protein
MFALRFILVEIPRIRRPSQMRHNGTVHFAVIQGIPIDIVEPSVGFDGAGSAFDVTEAFRRVDGAEARDEIAGIGRHGRGKAHATLYDPRWVACFSGAVVGWTAGVRRWGSSLFVDFHRVLVPEGRLANKKLVHQNAKGPPINRGTVACLP